MSPALFVDKWSRIEQKERSVAQTHFNELCDLLGVPKPLDEDPGGERYAFEKGLKKTTGGDGWADVWRRGCFAWEYKGKRKDLQAAFVQLQQYAVALENPPLLVVSDVARVKVTTNWTNTVSRTHEFDLTDLLKPEARARLALLWTDPEAWRPDLTRAALTARVAEEFASLAAELGVAGHPPERVAHFVNRLVFCMYAEDAGLLPGQLFTKMLDSAKGDPARFAPRASALFAAMRGGGEVGFEPVPWFNGGLFDDDEAIPLTALQIARVRRAAGQDWNAVDPSILGTLFERGLDPAKRAQLGAHYTGAEDILRVVEPVVLRPLRREWEGVRARLEGLKDARRREAEMDAFLARLRAVRVLDPACGSGNFLYLALRGLKDLEHRAILEAESLGLPPRFREVGPEAVRGIEVSPYAAELARVTVWIGELQWQIEHGFGVQRDPILRPLDTIQNRDALLNPDGTEAVWPVADFVVGNPPFLGDKKMKGALGTEYVDRLRAPYRDRVPGGADLVTYWFAKAGEALRSGAARRAGFVCTNGIRKGRNNEVLRGALAGNALFEAWSDLAWHDERGAQVRVSIVGLKRPDDHPGEEARLEGEPVAAIFPDLTSAEGGSVDLAAARPLPANASRSFNGVSLAGEFDVPDDVARRWLEEPNPTGLPNSDVLRPLWNGRDLTDGWRGRWVVDFGPTRELAECVGYDAPFAHVERAVKPVRATNNERVRREKWWRTGRPRPEMREATAGFSRRLVTPETSKHRWFRWLSDEQMPDHALIIIVAEDDFTFGILSSRIHEVWMLATGNRLGIGNDPRYNHTRTFQTFPFPSTSNPPPPHDSTEIAAAARALDLARENWLNPPEWTREETLVFPATPGGPWSRWIPETQPPNRPTAEAYYVRRVAKRDFASALAARTLTRLYNERPAWLRLAHERLDAAVAEAYGLLPDAPDARILAALLERNLAASGEGG